MEHVNPIVARKGLFLKSFPVKDYTDMLDFCAETELAMERHNIRDHRVVFTRVGMGKNIRLRDTWQVFLLDRGIQ